MKFGVFLMGTRDASHADIVDQVVEAEALGFEGVWLAERYFSNGDLLWPSPAVAAAFLAARTRRIRLGLAARVLPFHHPLQVAADAATLDVLSGGRLDLGVSRGSMDETPHVVFGVPREEARRRFDEALAVLSLALLGEPFSFTGRHFDLRDVTPSPRPVQRPRPPLYVVANHPTSLAAAADRGCSIFVSGALGTMEIAETIACYQARTAAAGFDPGAADIPVNRFVFVGETTAAALRAVREPFLEMLARRAPDLAASLEQRFGARGRSFELLADEIAVFGDAETCAARLRELSETAGVGHVLCSFNLITLPHELCLASMRRFARDVIPRLGPARPFLPSTLAPPRPAELASEAH